MIRNLPRTAEGVYRPRMVRLKINATYRCDRCCPNCNRATALFPSDGSDDIDPEYLKRMLVGCKGIGILFRSIWITGGEPTMHPKFLELVGVLGWYQRTVYRRAQILCYTYHRPETHWLIEKAVADFPRFRVTDTSKSSPEGQRFAAQYAPVDHPELGPGAPYFQGCWNARKCGVCIDWRGLWCCPIGAAIARAFMIPPTITKAEDYTEANIEAQYAPVCRYCGYFGFLKPKDVNKFDISKSWKDAMDAWRDKRIEMETKDPQQEAIQSPPTAPKSPGSVT